MNCDKCRNYDWYNDKCRKWDVVVDSREIHNCFEEMDTPLSDILKGMNGNGDLYKRDEDAQR